MRQYKEEQEEVHRDEISNNGIREQCFNYLNGFFDRNMHSIPFTAEGDFCNIMAVVITFDNRSAASDNNIKLEEEIALCLQILFTNLMLGTVLKTITMDKYDQQQQNDKTATLERFLSQIITRSMHPALVLLLDLLSNADTIKIAQKNSGLDKHN
ncbi:2012_t:CDS:2, partial [Funneliformis mosseae]